MNLTLSADDLSSSRLYPFTLTRSILDMRIGILTLREKWQYLSAGKADRVVAGILPIPENIIPTAALIDAIGTDGLGAVIAASKKIDYPWHIFQGNDEAIRSDFQFLTAGRKSVPLPAGNLVSGADQVFIEEGARIHFSILNASAGPIYIGKNVEIMEGSMIRGPVALCEGAVVKMGTKIYGATTIGPYCIAGGEIKNSVFFGFSNKGHDGYLGDAVIGEWCNLGAGTSNSNLKNTGGSLQVWNEEEQKYMEAGMKCGLLMGDYSRAAINTSFNTGTITGACCNIFGTGLTPKHIPSFSWGYDTTIKYNFEKALEHIGNWKKMKNCHLSNDEIRTLKHIFEQS